MDPISRRAAPLKLIHVLAGLRAGVLGGLVVLVWYLLIAEWQDQHWYAMANLLGSSFYGDTAFRSRFGLATLAGLALHIVSSGTAGVLFGLLLPHNIRAFRALLLGLAWGLAWYYLTYGFLLARWNPLIGVYTTENLLITAHLLFGLSIARTAALAASLDRSLAPPTEIAALRSLPAAPRMDEPVAFDPPAEVLLPEAPANEDAGSPPRSETAPGRHGNSIE